MRRARTLRERAWRLRLLQDLKGLSRDVRTRFNHQALVPGLPITKLIPRIGLKFPPALRTCWMLRITLAPPLASPAGGFLPRITLIADWAIPKVRASGLVGSARVVRTALRVEPLPFSPMPTTTDLETSGDDRDHLPTNENEQDN
jgi:hypothetical protein